VRAADVGDQPRHVAAVRHEVERVDLLGGGVEDDELAAEPVEGPDDQRPVCPYPATMRNGSEIRRTLRSKCCTASACRKRRSCSSVSRAPMAYAHATTVR
jgi:hypothetical protein